MLIRLRKKVLFLVILFSFSIFSQSVEFDSNIYSPESQGFSSKRIYKLNSSMKDYVDNGKISCVQTAIMRNGKIIHFNSYGYSDLKTKELIDEKSIFRIYSMTKPIVSIALMMLYEEGKFLLDDPIEKYIPEFKNMKYYDGENIVKSNSKIKIIDLLRHTSGIGYGWGYDKVDYFYKYKVTPHEQFKNINSSKELIKKIASIPLYFEPGKYWKYGLSTNVCGYLVELISNESLDVFLKKRLFNPLGMNDTYFNLPKNKLGRLIKNYTSDSDGKLIELDDYLTTRHDKNLDWFDGGGGLVSTSMNYLRFCQMLLNMGELDNKRILSPKTVEFIVSNHTIGIEPFKPIIVGIGGGSRSYLPDEGSAFGLGFSITENVAKSMILGSKGTYGWSGAAGTYFRIDPKENLIYLLMIQQQPHSYIKIRDYFQKLVYQSIID